MSKATIALSRCAMAGLSTNLSKVIRRLGKRAASEKDPDALLAYADMMQALLLAEDILLTKVEDIQRQLEAIQR